MLKAQVLKHLLRVPSTTESVSSDVEGNIPLTVLWSDPLTPGTYDVIVDFNGNGEYDVDIDALQDNQVQLTGGFFALSEYTFGTILALTACFTSLGVIAGI
jgi:hypothetical protein